jgi:uncharacterized membrane protein
MNTMSKARASRRTAVLIALGFIWVGASITPILTTRAQAATRLENALAAAAGRAAGRTANRIVSRGVVRAAERDKRPACWAGARELRLHGLRHAIFVHECLRVL